MSIMGPTCGETALPAARDQAVLNVLDNLRKFLSLTTNAFCRLMREAKMWYTIRREV